MAQATNLFASWSGSDIVHGVVVELPAGWVLRGATVLRYGYDALPVEVERGEGERFIVSSARPIQGPHELVLHVETSAVSGWGEWSIVPFVRSAATRRPAPREAFRVTRTVRVEHAEPAPDNRVMSFADAGRRGDEGAPLLLRRAALPDLGLRAAHTVSFWMKTTRLGEVVLSTWDGDERQAYPLELVVDRSGRLRYYRGQPGRHQSMTSRLPIADGRWHHVAVTNDPETGWARLFMDGVAADSLFSTVVPPVEARTPLAVGGRVPGRSAPAGDLGFYTGLMDELHVLPGARPAALVRSTMRQPAAPRARGVRIGFEEPVEAALVERRSPRTQRVASDLTFSRPLRHLRATAEGSTVRLSWEADDDQAAAFVVERSADGRRFDEVGRVAAGAAERGSLYRFSDPAVQGTVLYYRIRQVFSNGNERISGAIKLGLGAEEVPASVTLIGNFPNPFNTATTITYAVREALPVRLSVWDLSGHQVMLLVSQVQTPGTYEVQFHGGDLPSGTYFIRLETPLGLQSHKMILTK